MKTLIIYLVAMSVLSCGTQKIQNQITGSEFIEMVRGMDADTRDQVFTELVINGGLPEFMTEFVRIDVSIVDSITGRTINGHYYVMPDYLSIGTNDDFIRMPIQPRYAQRIANHFGSFLSTRKISDDVWQAAVVKLEPRPLTVDRDSLHTFVKHNQIIEEQRQNRSGLIAGHKKDVIITYRLSRDPRPNRVALYGWHRLSGIPIQNIFTGHADWYVDYSHGFRLVKQTIYVDGNPMHYIDVMKHPVYRRLICDEVYCDFFAYPL